MKPEWMKTGPSWLRPAVVGVALSLAGTAQAVPINKSFEYTCTYPLIGDQPLTAEITTDIPEEQPAGEPTGAFDLEVLATARGDTRQGLDLVGATQVEGDANAASNLSGNNLDLDLDVPITIPQQTVEGDTGSFQLNANGSTPSLTFTENNEGDVVITVGAMDMNLIARDSSGNPVQFPNSDPDTGEFPVPCTMSSSDNVLHTFRVTTPPDGEPNITTSPTAEEGVDFGNVQAGTNASASVTVTNTGALPLGINGVTIGGTDAGAYMQSNNCTTVAAEGGTCTVDLTFMAQGEGERNATLTIDSTDPDEGTVTIPITGSSVPPEPILEVDPGQVDFGEVDINSATGSATVTVTNAGPDQSVLDVTGASISGPNAGDFSRTNNCTQVSGGDDCTVDLTFDPSAVGDRSATLTINTNDGAQDVSLTGTGTDDSTEPGAEFEGSLEGNTKLRKLHRRIPLSGMVSATVELSSGALEANLQLNETKATLGLPFSKLEIDVAFEEVEPTTGTFQAGNLSTDSRLDIVLTEIRANFFGFKIPIGGGDQCRTMDPANVALSNPEDEPFSLQEGGSLEGTYSIPPVDNCGGLESLINPIMAGPGNKITLFVEPKS